MIHRIFVDSAFKAIKNNINYNVCQLFNSTNFSTNTVINATSSTVTVTNFTHSAQAVLADQKVPLEDNPEDMTFILPSVPYYSIMDPSTTPGLPWTQALTAGMKTAEKVRDTGIMPVAFGTSIRLDQQMPTTGAVGSRTFTGALFHRWAVAGVSRPLPAPDSNVMFERVQFGDLELRVMMQYNLYPKDAWIVNIDCGYGLSVVRDNMGVLFSIAE